MTYQDYLERITIPLTDEGRLAGMNVFIEWDYEFDHDDAGGVLSDRLAEIGYDDDLDEFIEDTSAMAQLYHPSYAREVRLW